MIAINLGNHQQCFWTVFIDTSKDTDLHRFNEREWLLVGHKNTVSTSPKLGVLNSKLVPDDWTVRNPV